MTAAAVALSTDYLRYSQSNIIKAATNNHRNTSNSDERQHFALLFFFYFLLLQSAGEPESEPKFQKKDKKNY